MKDFNNLSVNRSSEVNLSHNRGSQHCEMHKDIPLTDASLALVALVMGENIDVVC